MTIPCDCCPTTITRCRRVDPTCNSAPAIVPGLVTSPVPNQALVTDNPNGYGIVNIAATADGNNSGGSYGGINSGLGNATGVIVEYRWSNAVNKVVQIRLWNNAGGSVNDEDGIGTAVATLLDADGNILWQGALVAGNGGAIFTTNLNGTANEINGVRVLRLSNITNLGTHKHTWQHHPDRWSAVGRRRCFGGLTNGSEAAPNILWRDINFRLRYSAIITWACPLGTIRGYVEGLDAGLTLGAGTLVQTNGPHTITFKSQVAFNGTIVTNRPANFSSLTITNGSVITVSGNQTNNFVVNFTFPENAVLSPVFGTLCDGVMTWYDTGGNVVPAAQIKDCH